MSEPEKAPAFPRYVLWLIASLIFGHTVVMSREMRTDRATYLCVESWKLGLFPKSCGDLIARRDQSKETEG